MICQFCKRNRETDDGICKNKKAEDGLPFRCTGPWSREKLEVFTVYIDIFARAMKGKWPKLVYIDLFSGPGKCFDHENEVFFDASPLIAAKLQFYFDKLIFVEKNEKTLGYLKERVKGLKNVEFVLGDCNEKIDSIIEKISMNSLCFFFADQTGLQFKFQTLKKILSSNKGKNDVIELLPHEMAIKRNLKKWKSDGKSKILDDFLGVENSISKIKNYQDLENLYMKSIKDIDPSNRYQMFSSSKAFRSSNNVPLYHLFLISSHSLTKKFFQQSLKSKQQSLF